MAGCSIGTPVGFSSGQAWTVPLVGPLEDGLLITPVTVNGHGPYLFAIDPDANISEVDTQVVREAHLWSGRGPRRIDETYSHRPRAYAELLDLQVAGLTIDRRDAMVFAVGTYDTEGRHIAGILGRDVLADSLVFGFDRDQGVATLSTVAAFRPPADAVAIPYEVVGGANDPSPRVRALWLGGGSGVPVVPRRVVKATIDDHTFAMHLDLGGAVSQLAEARWPAARLAPVAVDLRLFDEAGSTREVRRVGLASQVALDGIATKEVTFAPYVEARFPFTHIDGALGLDFFRDYSVFASWDAHTFYARPRGDAGAATTARLGRWGAALPACAHPGCVAAEVVPTANGPVLHVVRDPEAAGRPLEVGLTTTGAERSAVPLVVELPGNITQLTRPVSPSYAGATLVVTDVSPFPRACPTAGGCVRQLAQLGRAPHLLHGQTPMIAPMAAYDTAQ